MERMEKTLEATRSNFNTVRTGRASPSLLDRVEVCVEIIWLFMTIPFSVSDQKHSNIVGGFLRDWVVLSMGRWNTMALQSFSKALPKSAHQMVAHSSSNPLTNQGDFVFLLWALWSPRNRLSGLKDFPWHPCWVWQSFLGHRGIYGRIDNETNWYMEMSESGNGTK
jgi:hypothetical protein